MNSVCTVTGRDVPSHTDKGFPGKGASYLIIRQPIVTQDFLGVCMSAEEGIRGWFFAMAPLPIGLNTKFSELVKKETCSGIHRGLSLQPFCEVWHGCSSGIITC